MRLAAAWLRANLPVLDRAVIVHSDYRLGNFLFTEHDSKISAWLDWELGRIPSWSIFNAPQHSDAQPCVA